jgi:hypothetical protein
LRALPSTAAFFSRDDITLPPPSFLIRLRQTGPLVEGAQIPLSERKEEEKKKKRRRKEEEKKKKRRRKEAIFFFFF